jgi:ubiquinone/menaquinone biosynthesis C-methylase UbiE
MLKLAQNRTQKAGLKNLYFREGDLNTKIHFEGGCFSRILFIHSFYLLENPGRTLQDLCSILHEEGEVILCNPSRRLSARELWAGGIFFLREVNREEGFSSFIIFLLIALGMGLLNGIIQRQKQKNVFSCWNEKEIENLLKTSGLKIKWLKKSCLGEGHLLVCAGKES